MVFSQLRAVLVVVSVLLAAATANAGQANPPVPPIMKFTGTLSGVGGQVSVAFALYAEQTGGAPLWTESQDVIVDASGRYTVTLGATRPEGLPMELFASGTARWVGVQAAGQAEQPRILLMSVPYAIKAADAETVGGKPLSAFVLAGDTTGKGADGLTYVDTRVLKNGLSGAGPLPQGVGTPGYIGLFSTPTDLVNSVMFQSGGSIGVGTTTPAASFHSVASAAPGAFFDVYSNSLGALPVVYRTARGTPGAPSAVQTDDILGGLAVRGYGATGFSAGRGQVMFKAAENWTDAANGTYLSMTTTPIGSTTWVERLHISPAGYVGVGTSNPQFPIDVQLARGGATYARFGTDSSFPLFLIAGNPHVGFNAYFDGGYNYGRNGFAGYLAFNQSVLGAFTFATAPSGTADTGATMTTRMTITNLGLVGIGTTSPATSLDVVGSIHATADVAAVGAVSGSDGTFSSPASNGTAVTGVANVGTNAWGVYGTSSSGIGVRGESGGATGAAGQFINSNASGKAITAVVNGVEVMTATATGVHAGPGMTGTPVAHGVVGSSGNWLGLSHSSNVGGVTRTATGTYDVSVTGEVLDFQHYTAMITMADSGPGMTSFFFSGSGHLIISTFDSGGVVFDRAFTFVIFKM